MRRMETLLLQPNRWMRYELVSFVCDFLLFYSCCSLCVGRSILAAGGCICCIVLRVQAIKPHTTHTLPRIHQSPYFLPFTVSGDALLIYLESGGLQHLRLHHETKLKMAQSGHVGLRRLVAKSAIAAWKEEEKDSDLGLNHGQQGAKGEVVSGNPRNTVDRRRGVIRTVSRLHTGEASSEETEHVALKRKQILMELLSAVGLFDPPHTPSFVTRRQKLVCVRAVSTRVGGSESESISVSRDVLEFIASRASSPQFCFLIHSIEGTKLLASLLGDDFYPLPIQRLAARFLANFVRCTPSLQTAVAKAIRCTPYESGPRDPMINVYISCILQPPSWQ